MTSSSGVSQEGLKGLSLKPRRLRIESGNGRGAWRYEEKDGICVVVEACDPAGVYVGTLQVMVSNAVIDDYLRRRKR